MPGRGKRQTLFVGSTEAIRDLPIAELFSPPVYPTTSRRVVFSPANQSAQPAPPKNK